MRRVASAGVNGLDAAIAQVVAVDVADEHDIDAAEARVVGSGDRPPGVVQNPQPAGIFEHQGAIARAGLAFVTAEGRDANACACRQGDDWRDRGEEQQD